MNVAESMGEDPGNKRGLGGRGGSLWETGKEAQAGCEFIPKVVETGRNWKKNCNKA